MGKFLLLLTAGICAGLAIVYRWKSAQPAATAAQRVFSKEQLASYNGKDGAPLYLAILGEVYDVSSSPKHYGAEGGYAFFVGRDASRAYVTGKFQDDLSDDMEGLSREQFLGLLEWRDFYRKHEQYTFQGRLASQFYDPQGRATPLLRHVESEAAQAKDQEQLMREEEAKMERCNVRWTEAEGGTVWCEEGKYPRKVFLQLPGGKPTTRCACFGDWGWSDVRQIYPDCAPDASTCKLPNPTPVAPAKVQPGEDTAEAQNVETPDEPAEESL